jgi:hypothetical protein
MEPVVEVPPRPLRVVYVETRLLPMEPVVEVPPKPLRVEYRETLWPLMEPVVVSPPKPFRVVYRFVWADAATLTRTTAKTERIAFI